MARPFKDFAGLGSVAFRARCARPPLHGAQTDAISFYRNNVTLPFVNVVKHTSRNADR